MHLIIRVYIIIVFLIQANFILGHFKNFNFKGKLYCKHLIFVASKFGYFKMLTHWRYLILAVIQFNILYDNVLFS